MLQDYEIKRTKTKFEKTILYIELLLVLIIIQSALSLFNVEAVDEEAIRFRLLANSNAPVDQQIKKEIQQEIEPLIEGAVATSKSYKELETNLEALEGTIIEIARVHSNGEKVTLVRKGALFPPKRSGLVIHPQSAYDAYILTIGSGRGDNWWCALFPKICFPDEETVEEEPEQELEEEKVTFFVWEWIKDIFA
ncbi:stage II sporulation protein R [Sporosarcina sp. G11-34]|uniref:stage II sporulation protein R n=1 Tax=Sporosarcina sp. G11-34 TaxID=2849605 RepID=UPI0022A9E5F5|nr:stage II sporulation protein R [Sporosarcina sp. G11-34]MCZ2257526.1 stage II sporulation protein R [Sporosarcina sp. G11-34]